MNKSTMKILCIILYLASFAATAQFWDDNSPHIELYIDNSAAIHVTSDRFLSLGMDTSLITHKWRNFSFSSRKVLNLATALGPAFLRHGGTTSDALVFDPTADNNVEPSEYPNGTTTMTANDWDNINKFTQKVGWDLVFTLNALERDSVNRWDPTNANLLLHYSSQHNYKLSWEFGNEPNSFNHVFAVNVTGAQLGNDFYHLRKLLNSYPLYKNSLLIGPDVSKPKPPALDYVDQFLQTKAKDVVDAVSFHQYYINGRIATVEDFMNSTLFNVFRMQLNLANAVIKNRLPNAPIWIGETASAYGGGSRNLTNRFVDGFLWLDKLGLCASHGINVVIRQSFYGGFYGLLDENLDPLPDYWLSLLFKRLVGQKVLHASLYNTDDNYRFYAHCTSHKNPLYKTGSVTIFGMNLGASKITVRLPPDYYGSEIHEYLFTPDEGLQSDATFLNGKKVHLMDNFDLPKFLPNVLSATSFIKVPKHSYGFWVVPNVKAPACMH